MHLRGTTHVRDVIITTRTCIALSCRATHLLNQPKAVFDRSSGVEIHPDALRIVLSAQDTTLFSGSKKTTYAPSLQDLFIIWTRRKVKQDDLSVLTKLLLPVVSSAYPALRELVEIRQIIYKISNSVYLLPGAYYYMFWSVPS